MSRASRPPLRSALPLAVLTAILVAACSGGTASPSPTASPAPTTAPSAAAAPSATPAPAFPLTLTDDEGGSVTLAAEPRKVVSLTPAVTETLFALGAGDRIVGNDDYDDFPPEAKDLTHVASYTGVDVEKIVSLEPDLVIAGGQGFTDPNAVAQLRLLGIPVFVIYATDVPDVLADIRTLGTLVGRAEAATAMTDAMQQGIDAIVAVTSTLPQPRVFYEIDATKEIYGPADGSFVEGMVKLAGGAPITTGSPTVYSIALETLVAADPEVIVLGDAAYGTTVEAVVARQGWGSMTAVKTGAIRPVDDTVVTRPGPRLVQGLAALAAAIHPDATFPPAPSFPPLGAE